MIYAGSLSNSPLYMFPQDFQRQRAQSFLRGPASDDSVNIWGSVSWLYVSDYHKESGCSWREGCRGVWYACFMRDRKNSLLQPQRPVMAHTTLKTPVWIKCQFGDLGRLLLCVCVSGALFFFLHKDWRRTFAPMIWSLHPWDDLRGFCVSHGPRTFSAPVGGALS